jgi:NAD(P)-dependent dehydrogenase (short-subunit alcohol dehydrogenase family)
VLVAGYARILQTSSVESQQSSPGYLPYAVSKWALMAMQEQWYSTHAAENVRACSALCRPALWPARACVQFHSLGACLASPWWVATHEAMCLHGGVGWCGASGLCNPCEVQDRSLQLLCCLAGSKSGCVCK